MQILRITLLSLITHNILLSSANNDSFSIIKYNYENIREFQIVFINHVFKSYIFK